MTPYIWQNDNLTQALTELNPIWHNGDDFTHSQKITTDTRTIEQGDIFLALKGDNFDGHDYVAAAFDKGAVLAITSRQVGEFAQIVVSDTHLALGKLGKYRRDVHPDLTVIALTGSSGKTSSKEMLGSIFGQLAPTLLTRGNLNNDLGVPMMLLELTDEHRFAVLELGANHVGEIAYTASLVRPDVACVLNIGTAHLGEFGGRDNIARAKAEIFQGLGENGVAIMPLGDDYFEFLRGEAYRLGKREMSFGETSVPFDKAPIDWSHLSDDEKAYVESLDSVQVMGDVFADDIELHPTHSSFELVANLAVDEIDSTSVNLSFVGEHNVSNALAAASCAVALGVPLDKIKSGLERAAPPKGRLTRMAFGEHTLIDDTYNANPNSILAAAQVLTAETAQKILVLGDIAELGDGAVGEHTKLGQALSEFAVDKVLTVGELMKHCTDAINAKQAGMAEHFDDKDDLLTRLKQLLNTPSAVLFKGSRMARMETLIEALMAGE
ncbi:MAG: UDP-N-acetylmuramoyl-tripeptide--D-alanyl-D-alanine ligase [Moraxella sp.]|nr:UDP-N-acetylmuramoyl-tripeptide--D-alanyl-D-alanine ligase [Moraxella sp.]